MEINADIENRKTLAAMLGIDEEEAETLLDMSILITFNSEDLVANLFAKELGVLLQRTAAAVFYEQNLSQRPAVEIIIGKAKPQTVATPIYVEISKDKISVSKKPQGQQLCQIRHPVFLLIGACFVAAKCFGTYFSDRFPYKVDEPLAVDFEQLFGDDYDAFNKPIDFGTTYLAGAGAVGNGFIYGLRYFDVKGAMHVVDPKIVKEGNLNRCMFFTKMDVGKPKAEQICNNANPYFRNLRLIPRNSTIHDLEEHDMGPWLKRLIVTVDSRRARRSLQEEFPGEVYDSSTTGIQEVVLHFNEQPIGKNACLSCIYSQESDELAHEKHVAEVLGVGVDDIKAGFVNDLAARMIANKYKNLNPEAIVNMAYDSLFKQLCGQGMLKTTADKQVLAPFAFVSVLAGTFLAVETVRRIRKSNIIQPYNFWRISPYNSPVLRLQRTREKRVDCEFCSNPIMISVSEKLWK